MSGASFWVSSWVPGPSQNLTPPLTLNLNEPKKLTLTLPPILTLTLILNLNPKYRPPQNAWARYGLERVDLNRCLTWSHFGRGEGSDGGTPMLPLLGDLEFYWWGGFPCWHHYILGFQENLLISWRALFWSDTWNQKLRAVVVRCPMWSTCDLQWHCNYMWSVENTVAHAIFASSLTM